MKKHTRSLPPIFGTATLAAESINREARTVDLVFYSGATVFRAPMFADAYELEFEVSRKAAKLGRLNAGAPLIDSHRTYGGLEAILGVVEKAWIEDGQARATVRFSQRPEVDPVWRDVLDGVVKNVSMGTYILAMDEVTEKGADMKRFRATSWEPTEISLVGVPADAGAQVLEANAAKTRPCRISFSASAGAEAPNRAGAPEENRMRIRVRLIATDKIVEIDEKDFDEKLHREELSDADRKPMADADDDLEVSAPPSRLVDEALAKERIHAAEVKRIAAHFGLDRVWAQRHVHLGTSIEQVLSNAADERAKRAPVTINDIGSGDDRDSSGWRMDRMVEALAARATHSEVPESARQYAYSTLVEMAYECLSWKGMARGLDVRGNATRIVELALTTSDYPNLLANAANKILLPDYDAAQPTYRLLAERQDLPDFKTASVLKAGDFPVPLQVAEEGEIKLGTFSEAKDSYALATYGRRLLFSFQSIVNDDLGAFARVMRGAAIRLADYENSLWFTLLLSGGGTGPTLGDNGALFNTTAVTTAGGHANLLNSGTAISVESIGVCRAAMRKQVSLDGLKLNILPRYILTSPEKETLARQFTTQITPALGSSVNPWAGTLEPIADANLSTANPWYLFADPTRAAVSVYGYLQGQAGPSVATRQGFEVLGVEMRVALHFGVAFVDHRGAYKNPGA
jgi:hypothetical protein